jgi:hypothetical protein
MTIPIKKALVCKYCPEGTGIIWNPKDAWSDAKGEVKCLKCVETDTRKMMIRVLGPDHPKNKDFLIEEQRKIDEWNTYAHTMNDINRRMGGTKNVLELKKNPYLEDNKRISTHPDFMKIRKGKSDKVI